MTTTNDEVAVLIPGTTTLVEIEGAHDRASKTYPLDAVATGVLKDSSGNAVSGADNLQLQYVAGTFGAASIYRATIPHSITLTAGAEYKVVVTVVVSGAIYRVFTRDCVALSKPD